MKIKSTKNIIKEIEGTNTFEVKTIGKRQDLEELKDKLTMHGFNFDKDGKLLNGYERMNALIERAKRLSGENQLDSIEVVSSIQNDVNEYLSLYVVLREYGMCEFKYILDMNNIEVLTDGDESGTLTAKVVINLKSDDNGRLMTWFEIDNNKTENIITIPNYRSHDFSYDVKNTNDNIDNKILIYTDINDITSKVDTGMNVMLRGKDSLYNVIAVNRTTNDKLKLILIDNNLRGKIAGKSLKSIFENIKTEKLREVGIDAKNGDGSFKTMEEVLLEISDFEDEEIVKIGRILVGEYNANHLIATVNNLKND